MVLILPVDIDRDNCAYVGETAPIYDRNENLAAVDNIKNFIGYPMNYGKRDKIQLHTTSIIGTACFNGIVSSLMRLLGYGEKCVEN